MLLAIVCASSVLMCMYVHSMAETINCIKLRKWIREKAK